MRVTGGVLLHRVVECPPGVIRPAMDRMRESLFSILNSRDLIVGATFLDLFAGSGIMSIEAASRGAKSLTLIEKDYGKKKVLEHNLLLLKDVEDTTEGHPTYTLCMKDVFTFLEESSSAGHSIIYADPPFPLKDKERILDLIDKNETLLRDGGVFIVHIPREEQKLWKEKSDSGRLELVDNRTYGRSVLLFYK